MDNRGFLMLDALIALSIFALVVLIASSVFYTSSRIYLNNASALKSLRDLENRLEILYTADSWQDINENLLPAGAEYEYTATPYGTEQLKLRVEIRGGIREFLLERRPAADGQ